MSTELTNKERERVLEKLEELEATIDAIKRDVRVMMQIHELLHPELVEEARQQLEDEAE